MDKTITINNLINSNNQEKKLTQTNLAKKAEIQSILEKYNLKTPKKSKTNAITTTYEIKPKDANQIIHVSKSTPSIPNQPNQKENVSSISNNCSINEGNINKQIQDKRETKPTPTSLLLLEHSQSKSIANNEESLPIKKIISDSKQVSVKELLEKDKAAKEAKKNEMPSAIIQKSSRGNISSSNEKINIYNFIPKIRQNLTNTSKINNSIISKGNNENNNSYDSSNIKRVSINPNLNEEESLNYKGQTEPITTQFNNKVRQELSARVIQESAAAKAQSRTPSPIRNIQNERINKPLAIQQSSQFISKPISITSYGISPNRLIVSPENKIEEPREHRRIQIQTSGGGGKQARTLKAMNPFINNSFSQEKQQEQTKLQLNIQEETEGNNSGLRYLEEQRKELQKQQMLELQRFKQKKAEIIKLNNRKKEIELMRSIEAEKNKLRKIHAKQQELNEIYKITVEQNISSVGGETKKQTISTYDVDAKKTKKNLSKFIEPTDKAHIKSGKLKNNSNISGNNKTDKTVIDKPIIQLNTDIVNPDIIEVVDKPSVVIQMDDNTNKKSDVKEYIKDDLKKDKKESACDKSIIKKELKPGEPLKYYTRKDKNINISWPSKLELYDTSKFEDKLNIFLGIAPFFNKKQIKNKTSQEDILKELKEEYGFQKLDKFKPALLEVLYKIIIGDKIKFTFE